VTLPQLGNAFTPAVNSVLECWFGSTPASACVYDASTPNTIKAYLPTSVVLTSNPITLKITTKDVPELGLLSPSSPGDYQFIVGIHINDDPAIEQAEPWGHVSTVNILKDVTITTTCRTKGCPNKLEVQFNI
jgi:hypothetical protein